MDGDRVLVNWYELRQGCSMLKLQIADLASVHNKMNNPTVNYYSRFCQESSWCYWLRSLLTGLPASSLSNQSDPFQSQVRLCYIWSPNPTVASVSPRVKARLHSGSQSTITSLDSSPPALGTLGPCCFSDRPRMLSFAPVYLQIWPLTSVKSAQMSL